MRKKKVGKRWVMLLSDPIILLCLDPNQELLWNLGHEARPIVILRIMATIVMFPGASLYVKSQLSLSPSKESKYLLPSQPLSQHFSSSLLIRRPIRYSQIVSCYPDQSSSPRTRLNLNPSTKLFVSGLSFRTTEESLRNAFNNFGELVEVNLMMDKIANRPRGFAFLRYATEEESHKAIEGMHGKKKSIYVHSRWSSKFSELDMLSYIFWG
ncbi:serine/arginine-rich splicing factor SR45a isoform X2 [Lycium ferocissimum]|uniref:serine/arginine-rich splicing factor SR45a isoform X2 n=1 Tax=Lycium ferocissimum TaxID=112874 RepID=UPI0028149C87|nr:serine/arginine-rich splicing factor SR45a isoform X2 [Lycium ferocissimum]